MKDNTNKEIKKPNNLVEEFTDNNLFQLIRGDNSLNTAEKLLLIILFSHKKTGIPSLKQIVNEAALQPDQAKNIIKKLLHNDKYGEPLNKLLKENNITIYKKNTKKDKSNDLYNKPGSRIARKWGQTFGTTQLTPTNFNRLKSFLEDGIEEEVILEVMELSAEKAQGNPINYSIHVLNNFLERGIMTQQDLEEERRRKEEHERQVQEDNRAKEKRKELHNIKKLKKKGWNK